jgi:hypothetical protein
MGNQGFVPGHHYSVTVVAAETSSASKVTATSAPQTTVVEPLPDPTAPASPTLSLSNWSGTSIQATVGMPSDPDLANVVVRFKEGTSGPASPADGQPAGTFYPGAATQSATVSADPLRTYAFAAFAADGTGNVSSVSAVRPAAALLAGPAASSVGYVAGPGYTTIRPAPGGSGLIRHAPGTTAPTVLDGVTSTGWLTSAWGDIARVPVANGAKVAVSVFTFTDQSMTAYRRTSFLLTGGASGDAASLATTTTVSYGARPAVTAKLTRTFATGGSAALSSTPVDLYRRPVGTSSWVKVGSATSSSTGVVSFVVPVPTGAVDYQAKATTLDSRVVASLVRRTLVKQTLSVTQSATSVRRGSAVTLSGTIGPKRATRVYLQRYVGGKWVNLTSVVSSTTGAYRVSYKPSVVGTYTLRGYVSATTTLLAGVSPTKVVKAT